MIVRGRDMKMILNFWLKIASALFSKCEFKKNLHKKVKDSFETSLVSIENLWKLCESLSDEYGDSVRRLSFSNLSCYV